MALIEVQQAEWKQRQTIFKVQGTRNLTNLKLILPEELKNKTWQRQLIQCTIDTVYKRDEKLNDGTEFRLDLLNNVMIQRRQN